MRAEQWKPVPSYPDYEVSDRGRVRSHKRDRIRIMNLFTKERYPRLSLYNRGCQRTWLVHSLVMLAFAGPCPDGMEVCHNDGNTLNNTIDNLRYDTKLNNEHDKTEEARIRMGQKIRDREVPEIRERYMQGGITQDVLAREYGVHYSSINRLVRGKSFRQLGGPITHAQETVVQIEPPAAQRVG